jgi:hypothetical protein
MAKKDEVKEEVKIESQEVMHEPQAMPVENQQAKHTQRRDPYQALMPGNEEIPAFGGVVGEIEHAIIVAEKRGNREAASDLRVLLNKLGEIRYHLVQCENKADEEIKHLYTRILKLFSR